jgi:hypothetical protein
MVRALLSVIYLERAVPDFFCGTVIARMKLLNLWQQSGFHTAVISPAITIVANHFALLYCDSLARWDIDVPAYLSFASWSQYPFPGDAEARERLFRVNVPPVFAFLREVRPQLCDSAYCFVDTVDDVLMK